MRRIRLHFKLMQIMYDSNEYIYMNVKSQSKSYQTPSRRLSMLQQRQMQPTRENPEQVAHRNLKKDNISISKPLNSSIRKNEVLKRTRKLQNGRACMLHYKDKTCSPLLKM